MENEEDVAAFKDFEDDGASEAAAPSEVNRKTLKNREIMLIKLNDKHLTKVTCLIMGPALKPFWKSNKMDNLKSEN